ncbi:MAG: TonB-dependent receptor, partial [Sphingomonadales bacterium]
MKAYYALGLFGAGLLMPISAWAQTEDVATAQEIEENEEIIVQATRSGRRVQDEPLRVEVINREEIEEKILMRPGNIATILSETGGLRVQVTAPALGAANIRVQG